MWQRGPDCALSMSPPKCTVLVSRTSPVELEGPLDRLDSSPHGDRTAGQSHGNGTGRRGCQLPWQEEQRLLLGAPSSLGALLACWAQTQYSS